MKNESLIDQRWATFVTNSAHRRERELERSARRDRPPYRDQLHDSPSQRNLLRHQRAGTGVVAHSRIVVRLGRCRRNAQSIRGFSSRCDSRASSVPGVPQMAILERNPLPRWSDGHVVLLGGACHPTIHTWLKAPLRLSKTRRCSRVVSMRWEEQTSRPSSNSMKNIVSRAHR